MRLLGVMLSVMILPVLATAQLEWPQRPGPDPALIAVDQPEGDIGLSLRTADETDVLHYN
jgi:hypothetical protein